jgi:hypothetical protein
MGAYRFLYGRRVLDLFVGATVLPEEILDALRLDRLWHENLEIAMKIRSR